MSLFQISTIEEYNTACKNAFENPETFWDDIASHYQWQKRWSKTLNWNFKEPKINWFQGGKLNITENCLDRHLKNNGETIALIWEPNNPKESEIRMTYSELHLAVCKFSNVLKSKGIKKGDRVAIYMPMIPELTIGVLACARIGAIHNVVFAGFSSQALADRINDSTCCAVLTSDGMYRGSKNLAVKTTVDQALKSCTSVKTVVVIKRDNSDIKMTETRDIWYHEAEQEVSDHCPAEPMDSEDMLFILYTSGSTGKPKGIAHTCGGYMVYAGYSFKNVFQYQNGDIYWCTADVGWITGHSYIIYGPLLNSATTLMFEGVPTWPNAGRFWEICDKYGVTQFYTAPTAIRALMALGDKWVKASSLNTLKVIGSVGEPINKEAWDWYEKVVGRGNCPIVDTWWQTETGGIMISGLGNICKQRATFAGMPLPGIQPVLLDMDGKEISDDGIEGHLCIKYPWPSMLRTIYGDHQRCKDVYFSNYPGYYFTGDGAKREDGMFRIIGRVDDVINVSGHRFGTAEIENAINSSTLVTESAVVGYPHAIKGQGIYAFISLETGNHDDEKVNNSVISAVVESIGNIAKPDIIQIAPGLPKTRSGKIMRRILRKIAEGKTEDLGDTSTLLDPSVIDSLIKGKK
tara:strand:- start:1377 stop:3272 length:1896 start_codon:yes stop_codon:yes gene_type:complete